MREAPQEALTDRALANPREVRDFDVTGIPRTYLWRLLD